MQSVDKTILLLTNDLSEEYEVSKISAAAVNNSLTKAGYKTEICTFTQLLKNLSSFKERKDSLKVFSLAHGKFGEEGHLQALLANLNFDWVGSPAESSNLSFFKPAASAIFRSCGLDTPDELVLSSYNFSPNQVKSFCSLHKKLTIKPVDSGSGLGVEFLSGENFMEVQARIICAFQKHPVLLLQEYIPGIECTVACLEEGTKVHLGDALAIFLTKNNKFIADWYDYERRYSEGATEHVLLKHTPYAGFAQQLEKAALLAHKALKCQQLSRTDFLLNPAAGKFYILETNALPGFTSLSLFPDSLAERFSYSEIIDILLKNS